MILRSPCGEPVICQVCGEPLELPHACVIIKNSVQGAKVAAGPHTSGGAGSIPAPASSTHSAPDPYAADSVGADAGTTPAPDATSPKFRGGGPR